MNESQKQKLLNAKTRAFQIHQTNRGTMNEIQKQRLLNAARATRETLYSEDFSMVDFAKPCGTPQCVLGNYAYSGLQNTFNLEIKGRFYQYSVLVNVENGMNVEFNGQDIQDHFGVSQEEACELFSPSGCGLAQTPEQAADYIEAFVARKEAQNAKA